MKKEEFVSRYEMGASERDKVAWDVFEQDYPKVLRSLRRQFPDVERRWGRDCDPAIVATEAFGRFWLKVARYLESSRGATAQTQTYITRIAENLMRDRLRIVRGRAADDDIVDDPIAAAADDPGMTECLSMALDEFEDKHPLLHQIMMLCVEGHTHEHVAQALGLEAGNVRRKLYEARAILKNLITAQCGEGWP